jgi:hypothetical protein
LNGAYFGRIAPGIGIARIVAKSQLLFGKHRYAAEYSMQPAGM